jgi:hypothetical protein
LRIEKKLVKTFNTKLMRILNYVFGIYFDWNEKGCNIIQIAKIEKIIKTYNLKGLRIKKFQNNKKLTLQKKQLKNPIKNKR